VIAIRIRAIEHANVAVNQKKIRSIQRIGLNGCCDFSKDLRIKAVIVAGEQRGWREERSQESEVRSQKSEVRSQKSGVRRINNNYFGNDYFGN
jgi:ribosomal protein S4